MEISPFDKAIKAFTTPYTEDFDSVMGLLDQEWEAARTSMLQAEYRGHMADADAHVEEMQRIYQMMARRAETLLAGANGKP